MISICIPVYNKDIRPLSRELQKQMQGLTVPIELFLLDDRSADVYRNENRETSQWKGVRYEELDTNMGRSRIRNTMGGRARYNWLLFLDCDVRIPDSGFLARYVRAMEEGNAVICGGHTYPQKNPGRRRYLRHIYGHRVEAMPAAQRNVNPNASFKTSNFIVSREVFLSNPLDERLKGYGHEDTLFGWMMFQAGIIIEHIDNPVIHYSEESNRQFLHKVRESIRQLIQLEQYPDLPQYFFEAVRLVYYAQTLKKRKLAYPVRMLFTGLEPLLRSYFSLGGSSLKLLAFYKLAYYLHLQAKQPTAR